MHPAEKIRLAINGYGVIGKRVADAVVCQDDMAVPACAISSQTGGHAWPCDAAIGCSGHRLL
jgi:hypothetical protein